MTLFTEQYQEPPLVDLAPQHFGLLTAWRRAQKRITDSHIVATLCQDARR